MENKEVPKVRKAPKTLRISKYNNARRNSVHSLDQSVFNASNSTKVETFPRKSSYPKLNDHASTSVSTRLITQQDTIVKTNISIDVPQIVINKTPTKEENTDVKQIVESPKSETIKGNVYTLYKLLRASRSPNNSIELDNSGSSDNSTKSFETDSESPNTSYQSPATKICREIPCSKETSPAKDDQRTPNAKFSSKAESPLSLPPSPYKVSPKLNGFNKPDPNSSIEKKAAESQMRRSKTPSWSETVINDPILEEKVKVEARIKARKMEFCMQNFTSKSLENEDLAEACAGSSKPLQEQSPNSTEVKDKEIESLSPKTKINWPGRSSNGLNQTVNNQVILPAGVRKSPVLKTVTKQRSPRQQFEDKPSRFTNSRISNNEDDQDENDWSDKMVKAVMPIVEKTKFKTKGLKQQCDCESCDSYSNCPIWIANNIHFDTTENTDSRKTPLLKDTVGKIVKVERLYLPEVLVHGVFLPKPQTLETICFHANIKASLESLDCGTATKLQSYVWPSVQRNLNVFVTGPHSSGRSLSYLPAICSSVLAKKDLYEPLDQYEGPVVLVLCANGHKCEGLESLVNVLLGGVNDQCSVLNFKGSTKKVSCDILITNPESLEDGLKTECIGLKRICHLVLEDADKLLKKYPGIVKNLLVLLNQMQINRPHNKTIQLISVAEKWSLNLDNLLRRTYATPIVCFGDYLEAALYAKCNFRKTKLSVVHKKGFIADILKNYLVCKSVLFCCDKDVNDLSMFLNNHGIETISMQNDLTEDEIFENEDLWFCLRRGQFKVLLCTDVIFSRLRKVKNANYLIHFSLSDSINDFHQRFRCFSAYLNSPLDDEVLGETTSYLIVDEKSDHQLYSEYFNGLTRNLILNFKL